MGALQFREGTVDELQVEQFVEMLEPQMAVQLVEVPKIVAGLEVSSGEDGSSGPGRETRPTPPLQHSNCLLVKCSTTTESEVEGSSGEAGSFLAWSRRHDSPH